MISWGIISACMMFTRGTSSFYLLRLMLGIAEAGFFPGIVLYLTYWVPSSHRTGAMAAFLTSTALSGLVGNPLGGLLMKMDGIGGLHGWQWLFLLEGILPALLGISILLFPILPDRPAKASWLPAEEKDWIERELALDESEAQSHHIGNLWKAMGDGRLWILSATNFMLVSGLYGFIYWLPSIVKSISAISDARIGFVSGIPYALAAAAMVIIARRGSGREAEILWGDLCRYGIDWDGHRLPDAEVFADAWLGNARAVHYCGWNLRIARAVLDDSNKISEGKRGGRGDRDCELLQRPGRRGRTDGDWVDEAIDGELYGGSSIRLRGFGAGGGAFGDCAASGGSEAIKGGDLTTLPNRLRLGGIGRSAWTSDAVLLGEGVGLL